MSVKKGIKGKGEVKDSVNTCPMCKGYTIVNEDKPGFRECPRCVNDKNVGYSFELRDNVKELIEVSQKNSMFKKGDFLYGMDFTKNKFGDVLKFEITGEGKTKNDRGDEVEVYYTLCKKEKGEIPKEFAEKKMKATRKALLDDSIAKCERFIKFHESAMKESKEKVKEAKEQIKFLKK